MITDTPISHTQLVNIHSGALDYFTNLWDRGKENERYYACDPFTEKQKADYALQDRIPFSISSIPQKLNSIISTERTNRVSVKAQVKINPDDISEDPGQRQQLFEKEIKANLATIRLKMIEVQNSAQYKFSDIFASGVAAIYGVAKIWVDSDRHGEQVINLGEVDYQNFIWDRNAVDYEKNGCHWQAEKKYIYRVDAKRIYGKDAVKDLGIGDAAMRWGRKKHQYFVNYNRDGNSDLDLLTLIEHYHKVLRNYYTVLFNGVVVSTERKKSDAEKTLRMLQIPYLNSPEDLPPGDVIKTPKLMLDKYCFTYSGILEYEETEMEYFPYSIYQAFQFKDKIWTMTDVLKSMQQLANRLLAQIDYAFGVDIKNVYEIIIPALEGTGLTPQEAIRMIREEGYIPVMQKDALNPIKSQGMNPQWATIMGTMLQLIDEIGGGKTFTGTPNSTSQSGKAINALIGQGQLLTNAFIDNRNRFIQDLAKKELWFMKKYDTAPYVMKVQGGSLSPEMLQLLQQNKMYAPSQENPQAGYLKLNENNENYLENSDYELEIIEESLSDAKRDQEFQTLTAMEQTDQSLLLSQTWRENKLEKINTLSYEKRAKVIQEINVARQQQMQMEQQQREQAMNIEKAKVLISDKGQVVKNDNR